MKERKRDSRSNIHPLSSPTTRAVPTTPTHVFGSASPLLSVIGVVTVAATIVDDDDGSARQYAAVQCCRIGRSVVVAVAVAVGRSIEARRRRCDVRPLR